MSSLTSEQSAAKRAVEDAVDYLDTCGIRLPSFCITTERQGPVGNSWVIADDGDYQLNVGRYPVPFLRRWFVMHELGHILWAAHRPLRRKGFAKEFGTPQPPDYDEIHAKESWKTTLSLNLSWFAGPHRPEGQPSWYGARAGGEERFCELIALMYANADFSSNGPSDLEALWNTCWYEGLARMV